MHRLNARKPLDVYRFLRSELDSTYIQFIPIVQKRDSKRASPFEDAVSRLPMLGSPQARPGHPDSVVTDWSVDPEDYGYFLSRVFDEWRRKDLGKVLVNHFETLVAQHLGLPSQICIYGEFCGKGVAIEHDGSVYSCDHYVYPEYRLGRIQDSRWRRWCSRRSRSNSATPSRRRLPRYCRQCDYLKDCWGECPKNRLSAQPRWRSAASTISAPGSSVSTSTRSPEIERIVAGIRQHEASSARRPGQDFRLPGR